MTLLEEAAIEIESVADEFRETCAHYEFNHETGLEDYTWFDEAEEAEYNRLMDLARRLREADK